MSIETYLQQVGGWIIGSGLRILLIVILLLIAIKAAGSISNRILSLFQKQKDDEELKNEPKRLAPSFAMF